MVRTTLVVGDRDYLLAQSEDSNGLRERIETALHAGGGFVDFVVLGNRRSSVLITAHSQVAMHVETVAFDARDTGDEDVPFGGFYDIGVELL